jgi:polysaccharide pyruvyl transferase CsaB
MQERTSSDEQRPRFVILAFAGSDNLGDECIFAVEVAALRRRWPTCSIAAPAVVPARIAGLIERPLRQLALTHLFREIARADALIVGGGGIIQDDTSISNLIYFLLPIQFALSRKIPVVSYGLGVGPIHRRALRRWTARLFARFHRVCVRDRESATLLQHIGVPGALLQVTGDPAVGLPRPAPTIAVRPRPRVAIALRAYQARSARFVPRAWARRLGETPDLTLAHKVVPTLRWLREALAADFVFIPFQSPWDDRVHEAVVRSAGLESCSDRRSGPQSPADACEIVSGCDIVLGMRLHACILAAAAQRPFVALSYAAKVRAFADSLGVGKFAIDLHAAAPEDVCRQTRLLWESRTECAERLADGRRRLLEAEAGNLLAVQSALDDNGLEASFAMEPGPPAMGPNVEAE